MELYYYLPPKIKTTFERVKMPITFNDILQPSQLTRDELLARINSQPHFCRDQTSIELKHFTGTVQTSIVLYAVNLEQQIIGALTFSFSLTTENNKITDNSKKIILFHGICSPVKLGIGTLLINKLIEIAHANQVIYIELDCNNDKLVKYYKKFGFKVTRTEEISDDDSDDEEEESIIKHYMKLELSNASGGVTRRSRRSRRSKSQKNKYKKTFRNNKK